MLIGMGNIYESIRSELSTSIWLLIYCTGNAHVQWYHFYSVSILFLLVCIIDKIAHPRVENTANDPEKKTQRERESERRTRTATTYTNKFGIDMEKKKRFQLRLEGVFQDIGFI